MILLLHIAIALISVAFATVLLAAPSARKLYTHYALMGLTVSSGTYLVVAKPGHMVEACTMGILYAGVAILAALFARNKLAVQTVRIRNKKR